MSTFLTELFYKRNLHPDIRAGNSLWFIEQIGGQMMLVTAFEPDPNTWTNTYYYNASLNVLFKKIKKNGLYAWKRVSR